jgi:hypothetical protein
VTAEPLPPEDAIAAEVAAERAAQGMPPKITDPRILAQVARLVNEPNQQDTRMA